MTVFFVCFLQKEMCFYSAQYSYLNTKYSLVLVLKHGYCIDLDIMLF